MNIYEKLLNIQQELKAPKNQFNSFGKYNYRSCEDILEGLKPLLAKYQAVLLIADEIEQVGDRHYIKAIATLADTEKESFIVVQALAREEETKKGMDSSQITGSTSSYARKYALNGLFAIDDTKDSDGSNKGEDDNPEPAEPPKGNISDKQINRLFAIGTSRGQTKEVIDKSIKKDYSKDEAKDLTKTEYDELCKRLESLPIKK